MRSYKYNSSLTVGQREEEPKTARYEGRGPNLPADSKPLRWKFTETFEPRSLGVGRTVG
jgi:hypothetical protein